jgi:hypothetical protein
MSKGMVQEASSVSLLPVSLSPLQSIEIKSNHKPPDKLTSTSAVKLKQRRQKQMAEKRKTKEDRKGSRR